VKSVLVALAAVVAMTAGASAADLPARMPAKEPGLLSPEPISQWGGFYVGVSAGYGWGDTSHSSSGFGLPSTDFDVDGAMLGGTFGYNRQVGPWVWGFETDISKSWIKGDTTVASLGATNVGTELDWLSTVRGRVGHDVGYWGMGYITGGAAIGNIRASLTSLGLTAEQSTTRLGWTIGAGWERKITPNLSAKIEYLYVDFGSTNIGGLDVDLSTNIVRAGLNYRLGDLVH
jgi:outer membrane immunogenic protein